MQIIGQKIIDSAARDHADWRKSLKTWRRIVADAQWTCNSDIQQTFNTADPVGIYVIFDIAGNKARLVSIVNFDDKRVTVKEIVNHARYNKTEYK